MNCLYLSLLSLSSADSFDLVLLALSLSTLSLSSLTVSDSVARASLILMRLAMCRFVSFLGARPSVVTLTKSEGDSEYELPGSSCDCTVLMASGWLGSQLWKAYFSGSAAGEAVAVAADE